MAEVPPHMPTKEEILEYAKGLFFVENPGAPTPEEDELKEGSYWERARLDLMSGIHSQLEEYLHYLESEAERLREELGIEKPLPPEKRIRELEDEMSTLEERYKTTKERLKEAREEVKRLEEKVKPPEIEPIKIRIIKPFIEGFIAYTVGSVIETRDLHWALDKIEKGFAESVPPEVPVEVKPPPKELTKKEVEQLEDEFKALLMAELGRIPKDVMAEFRVTLRKVITSPYEEALEAILGKAKEIVARETLRKRVLERWRPPRVPRPPPPEEIIEVPEEVIIAPVELPKEPISPLPFPRAPTSEEKDIFWRHFVYEMARIGQDPKKWVDAWKERISLPYRSWEDLLITYKDLIESIETGKLLVFIPITRIPMPWREEKEEEWRYDAILHFIATKIYKSMEELIDALEMYGVRPVPTPEEVKEAAKKGWDEKNVWLSSVSKEDLAILGIEV